MKMRRRFPGIALAVWTTLAVAFTTPWGSIAATLRVERDGSGDYATIQPALDAAASGDTILIGPGEYTEYSMVRIPGYAWDVAVFGYSELPNLTIIGAGAGQTIIGPTAPMRDSSTYSAKGLVWVGGTELYLHGVAVKNCYEGLHVPRGTLNVAGCVFEDNSQGVVWSPQGMGGLFENDEFTSTLSFPEALAVLGPATGVTLRNVTSHSGGRFYFSSVMGAVLDSCDLAGGVSSVDCLFGSDVTISNCQIHDAENQQVAIREATCHIENSVLEGGVGANAVNALDWSVLTVTGSVLSGGGFAAIISQGASQITVHNSHVLKGAQWAVWSNGAIPGGHVTYDLSSNYWGTTSASNIAAWIWDSVDSSANWGTVNYQPFSSQEVPTESRSWGDLKALFR